MSGGLSVPLAQDCLKAYEEIKMKKTCRYVTYAFQKEPTQMIKIERVGGKEENWDTFIDSLPDKQARFTIFDAQYADGLMNKQKLIFVYWLPDALPIKDRVPMASIKEPLRGKLGGLKEVTVTGKKDKSWKEVISEI